MLRTHALTHVQRSAAISRAQVEGRPFSMGAMRMLRTHALTHTHKHTHTYLCTTCCMAWEAARLTVQPHVILTLTLALTAERRLGAHRKPVVLAADAPLQAAGEQPLFNSVPCRWCGKG